jgi:hypothetical protein
MGLTQNHGGWRRRDAAAYLGLVAPQEGRVRPRWARVTSVGDGEDSSRQEAGWGLLIYVLLVPVVAMPLFGEPRWFRLVAAFAVVVLVLNVVRVGRLYARLR